MMDKLTMKSADGSMYVHWGALAVSAAIMVLLVVVCIRSGEGMDGGLTYDQELQILQQMNPSANWSVNTQVHDGAALAALQGTSLDYPQIIDNPDDFFTMWGALTPTQQAEAGRMISTAARTNRRSGFTTSGSPPAFFGPTTDLRDRSWTPKDYDSAQNDVLLDRLNKLREDRGQQPLTAADAAKTESFGDSPGAFSESRLDDASRGM